MPEDRPPDQRPGYPIGTVLLAGLGSALATLLLSRIGLLGTLIGAALTPVIVITVQELGQRPIERVAAVSRVVRPDGTLVRAPRRAWQRVRWRRVLALAAVAFALVVAAFTAIEYAIGRPVAVERDRGILGTGPRRTPARQSPTPSPPATEPGTTTAEEGGTTTAPETATTAPTATAEEPTTTTEPPPGTTVPPPTDTVPTVTEPAEPVAPTTTGP